MHRIFALPAAPPSTANGSSFLFSSSAWSSRPFTAPSATPSASFLTSTLSLQITLSNLRAGALIGQLHNQFLLIASPLPKNQILISAIDQHAAAERIRKHAILAAIFPIDRFVFGDPPKQVERDEDLLYVRDGRAVVGATVEQIEYFEANQERIQAAYGWEAVADPHAKTLTVTKYPVVCHTHLSHDALLSYLTTPQKCPFRSSIDRHSCRYAIMFNTVLSREQMKEIVDGLGKTKNWTICAHGRPTIVPISIVPS